jgi:hypothetical protein
VTELDGASGRQGGWSFTGRRERAVESAWVEAAGGAGARRDGGRR